MEEHLLPNQPQRVAMIGNYPPRRCGIATFTHDLANSIRATGVEVDVIAMSDIAGYEYPGEVMLAIDQDDVEQYRDAASRLNAGPHELVHVQHEFGIFGGPAGRNLLVLLRDLKMAIVTTLHTVLCNPDGEQRAVLEEIAGLSQRLIVMSDKAKQLLVSVHNIPENKISIIHHGIPSLPETTPEAIKRDMGLEGRPVILTFGLLSPDKGIEYAIQALAKVKDAVYVVAGQTHPNILRNHRETYRDSLIATAVSAGVEDRVRFIDRYVSDEDLGCLIKMADLYVTPYLKAEQITSGTLAYTVGNGKAVISTPYWHAQELLADGRGRLVPMRDPEALAEAITDLIEHPEKRRTIESLAARLGQEMQWPRIAAKYVKCYESAIRQSSSLLREIVKSPVGKKEALPIPPIRLNHLQMLTDDTGIFQHATYSIPNRIEGYCLDDNARALLVTTQLEAAGFSDPALDELQSCYLSFCAHALDRQSGRFRNFMSYHRHWLEDVGSEDSHGRALWCLGTTARRAKNENVSKLAREIYQNGRLAPMDFTSPRAWSYAALGYAEQGDDDLLEEMANRLELLHQHCADRDWPWFEPCVTYANARIPQALIVAGHQLGNSDFLDLGLASLTWLCEVQSSKGIFCPIGNEGFYPRGGKPATSAEQPIEAAAQVSACWKAYSVTGDPQWKREADRAFGWFLGQNRSRTVVARVETGGCYDGLESFGPNLNQGAESTLSYLGALAEMTSSSMPIKRGTLR